MDKIGKWTELQMRNRPVKVIDITSQKQNKTKQGKERLDTFMTLEFVRYVGSETQRNISYSTLINTNPLLISTPLHHRFITSWIFPSPKTSVDKLPLWTETFSTISFASCFLVMNMNYCFATSVKKSKESTYFYSVNVSLLFLTSSKQVVL